MFCGRCSMVAPAGRTEKFFSSSLKRAMGSKAHEELAPEFALARAVIDARVTAGLTQEQLAQRMDTTQSVIARLEGGRTRPSTPPLERLAQPTGLPLRPRFR